MCVNGLYDFIVVNVVDGVEDEGKLMEQCISLYYYKDGKIYEGNNISMMSRIFSSKLGAIN
jgi:hypothetical protein